MDNASNQGGCWWLPSIFIFCCHTSSEAVQSHRQGQVTLLCVNLTVLWCGPINSLPDGDKSFAFARHTLGSAGVQPQHVEGALPAWEQAPCPFPGGPSTPWKILSHIWAVNVSKNITTNELWRVFLPYYLLWACWNWCSFTTTPSVTEVKVSLGQMSKKKNNNKKKK